MEEGQTEQDGGFLNRIIKKGSSKELEKPKSNFEQELFRNGTYHFDFEAEIKKSETEYHHYQKWLRNAQPFREQSSLQDFVGSERHEIMWKQFFDGAIPKSWGESWASVMDAVEEAGKRDVQLSDTLVNAGVSHSYHLVANRTGRNQRLSSQQLGLILAREDVPQWNSNEVVEAQRKRGMSDKELREAEKVAAEMRDKMRRKKAGQDKIEPPKKRLNPFNR